MKKLYFSGLISCGLLLAAAQTNGQSFFPYTENNAVVIRWSASSEQNIDRYIIEHSPDGVYFTTLHELVSKDATDAGNSYTDVDIFPAASINFYRLRTVLKEGGSFYSPIVKIDLYDQYRPILTPTVVHLGATLWLKNYHSQPLTVNIFNGRGALLGSWLVNSTTFNINTDRLPKGILFYRISDETHPLLGAGKLMIQ